MKITKFEGTSSYIKVTTNDNRIVKIQGEFLVGGFAHTGIQSTIGNHLMRCSNGWQDQGWNNKSNYRKV